MGKARAFSTEGEDANFLRESEDETYKVTQQNSYNLGSTTFSDQSGIGNFSQSGTDQTKANLTGALFRGNIGFLLQSAVLDDTTNTINLLFDQNDVAVSEVSSDVIVIISGVATTADLEIILGAQRPGQRLVLYNTDGNTITIKDASTAASPTDPNLIHTPGALDYIITGFESVQLVFDSIEEQWRIVGAVGTGGGTGYNLIQDEGISLTQRTTMNFIGNSVTAVDNPGQSRTDITINTPSGTVPDGTAENQHLEWDNSFLTWNAVDALTFGTTGPFAASGFLRTANDEIIFASRNAGNSDDIRLKINSSDRFIFEFPGSTVPLEIANNLIDVKTVDIVNIDRAKFVVSSGSMVPSNDTGILLNSNNQFQFNTDETNPFTFTFDNNNPSFVIDRDIVTTDSTTASVRSDSTDINAQSFLDIVKSFSIPLSLQEIGALNFIAGDSLGAGLLQYASITGKIEDATAGALDGSLRFEATLNNAVTNFMIINDGGSGLIKIFRGLDMVTNNIRAGGAGEGLTNTGHIDFIDNLATPAASLSIYSDGTDMLVNTGGGVVNLSDVGDGVFLDSTFRIQGSGDQTKQLAFEVDTFTTGTTRTFGWPNANGTVFVNPAQEELNLNTFDIFNIDSLTFMGTTGSLGVLNVGFSSLGSGGFRANILDAGQFQWTEENVLLMKLSEASSVTTLDLVGILASEINLSETNTGKVGTILQGSTTLQYTTTGTQHEFLVGTEPIVHINASGIAMQGLNFILTPQIGFSILGNIIEDDTGGMKFKTVPGDSFQWSDGTDIFADLSKDLFAINTMSMQFTQIPTPSDPGLDTLGKLFHNSADNRLSYKRRNDADTAFEVINLESGGGGGEFFGPWTANHNAGDFSLVNLKALGFNDAGGQISVAPNVFQFVTTSPSAPFRFTPQGTNILDIDDLGLEMQSGDIRMGNGNISGLNELQFNIAGQVIRDGTAAMTIEVGSGDTIDFIVNSVPGFQVNQTFCEFFNSFWDMTQRSPLPIFPPPVNQRRVFVDSVTEELSVIRPDSVIVSLEAGGTGDVSNAANVGIGTGLIFRDKIGSILNFKTLIGGLNIAISNNADDITISATGVAAGFYNTIQDEGSSEVQQPTLNFIGAGVSVSNDAGGNRTNVTIPGGGGPGIVSDVIIGTIDAGSNNAYLDEAFEVMGSFSFSNLGLNLPTTKPALPNVSHTVTAADFPVGINGIDYESFGFHLELLVRKVAGADKEFSVSATVNEQEIAADAVFQGSAIGTFFGGLDWGLSRSQRLTGPPLLVGDRIGAKVWITVGGAGLELEDFQQWIIPNKMEVNAQAETIEIDFTAPGSSILEGDIKGIQAFFIKDIRDGFNYNVGGGVDWRDIVNVNFSNRLTVTGSSAFNACRGAQSSNLRAVQSSFTQSWFKHRQVSF